MTDCLPIHQGPPGFCDFARLPKVSCPTCKGSGEIDRWVRAVEETSEDGMSTRALPWYVRDGKEQCLRCEGRRFFWLDECAPCVAPQPFCWTTDNWHIALFAPDPSTIPL